MNKALALDLGGTRLKMALMDNNGPLDIEFIDMDSDKGFIYHLPLIENKIKCLLKKNNVTNISGVGMATPGVVDPINKKVLKINKKYFDLVDLDLSRWIQRTFHCPFAIENDAKAALYGEMYYGSAKNKKNVVVVTLGTGIGTAVLLDGRVLNGNNFMAGNLGGHLTINQDGPTCTCGNIGCLEAYSGNWAIKKFHKSSIKEILETDHEIKKELIHNWSIGILNLIFAYDPELVILNGGPLESKDFFLINLKN